MMNNRIALIDGNNIAFGAYQQFYQSGGLLTNSVGIPTTIVFSIMRTLNALVDELQFNKCVLCWDIYGSKYRKSIWPEYKQARKKLPSPFPMEEYYKEMDDARDIYFKRLGILQASAKEIEADDLIGWLANKYVDLGNKIVIVSNDKDYYQLLNKKIKLYRPILKSIVDREEIMEKFGLKKCRDYMKILALIGDKDEVPGIYRLGEKTAIKLLNEFSWDLNKLIKECDKEFAIKKDGEKKPLRELKPSRSLALKLAKIRILDKQYNNWELRRLNKMWKRIERSKAVDRDTINLIEENLEFKKIKLTYILNRIGVKLMKRGDIKC